MEKYLINMVQRRQIEETAERLLQDFALQTGQVIQAPIPIMDIGSSLGLILRAAPSQAVSGAFFEEEGVLYTNSAETADPVWGIQRDRFSKAHEVAHFVLAEMDQNSPHTRIMWGIKGKETNEQLHNIGENLADQLAASLLMPRMTVIAECNKLKKIDVEAIPKLANIFNVSKQAMALRIIHLKENGENLRSTVDLEGLNHLIHQIGQNKAQWATARQETEIHAQVVEEQLTDEEVGMAIDRTVMDLIVGLGLVKVARGKSNASPSAHLKRPLIIEFAGPPNSGKDTQLNILLHSLRDRMHYRVHVIDDTYRNNELETPDNTSLNRFRQSTFRLLDKFINLFDKLSKYDVVLINKGIFDNLAFQRFYTLTKKQAEEEEQVYRKLLSQQPWGGTTDLVILLIVDPKLSIEREEQEVASAGAQLATEITEGPIRKVTKTTMKIENLDTLNDCYTSILQECSGQFRSIRVLHTLANEAKDKIALKFAPDISQCLTQPAKQEADSAKKSPAKNKAGKDKSEFQLNLL